jgi:hypothetical protein
VDPNTPKIVFLISLAVITMVILPVWAIVDIRRQLRDKQRGNKNAERRGGSGICNALQELDRLVTRPAVEYTMEAETPIFKREDDRGGK